MSDTINTTAIDPAAVNQQLLQMLVEEGYQASLDSDGDILFRFEGMSYSLCFDSGDPQFGKLVLTNVWRIESQDELARVLVALDEVNRRLKVVKGHTIRDQVWFTVEAWIGEPGQWQPILPRAIRALAHGLSMFAGQMRGEGTPPVRESHAAQQSLS